MICVIRRPPLQLLDDNIVDNENMAVETIDVVGGSAHLAAGRINRTKNGFIGCQTEIEKPCCDIRNSICLFVKFGMNKK